MCNNMAASNCDIAKWRLYAGWTLVTLGCAAPFLIPLILAAPLSATAKAGLSALMAFGLPEVLILLALPLLGKERIKAFFAPVRAFSSKLWGTLLDKKTYHND